MLKILSYIFLSTTFLCCKTEYNINKVAETSTKVNDIMVDVGDHELNFNIWKGNSKIPILFEAGGGDDLSVWDSIIKPIQIATGSTIITYSRAGFGKSTLNSDVTDISRHGILSEIADLELALKKLGYNGKIMLVSHSYGGYFSTLYANRHPDLVKSIVLIDVNHHFIEQFIDDLWKGWEPDLKNFYETRNWGMYYMASNIKETSRILNDMSIPNHIPVIDIMSGVSHLETQEYRNFWDQDHKNFVDNHSNSIGIIASGTQHHIWRDNPDLIINQISRAYSELSKKY